MFAHGSNFALYQPMATICWPIPTAFAKHQVTEDKREMAKDTEVEWGVIYIIIKNSVIAENPNPCS